MAKKKSHKAAKRDTGRLQVRPDTAEYRAAAQDQATRLRDEIDAALADARRTREEIEARIESQWHHRAPVAPRASNRKGRKKA